MLQSIRTQWRQGVHTLTRRELFRWSALLTLPAVFRHDAVTAAAGINLALKWVVFGSSGALAFQLVTGLIILAGRFVDQRRARRLTPS